jgi:hypothetical protein
VEANDPFYRAGVAILVAFFAVAVVVAAVTATTTDALVLAGIGVLIISAVLFSRRVIETRISRSNRRG